MMRACLIAGVAVGAFVIGIIRLLEDVDRAVKEAWA